jgi:hypothetical protein
VAFIFPDAKHRSEAPVGKCNPVFPVGGELSWMFLGGWS